MVIFAAVCFQLKKVFAARKTVTRVIIIAYTRMCDGLRCASERTHRNFFCLNRNCQWFPNFYLWVLIMKKEIPFLFSKMHSSIENWVSRLHFDSVSLVMIFGVREVTFTLCKYALCMIKKPVFPCDYKSTCPKWHPFSFGEVTKSWALWN